MAQHTQIAGVPGCRARAELTGTPPGDAMMEELLGLERQFWRAGAAFYREHVAASCLLVSPAMTALLSAADVAATIENAARWQKVEITDLYWLTLVPDVVALSYIARADRPGTATYVARVSSIYVRRDAEWKLAAHQHTPLSEA